MTFTDTEPRALFGSLISVADPTPHLSPPWYAIATGEERDSLETQARREIGFGHVLERQRLHAVGRREDRDDVLFHIHDGRWAIVHLAWTPRPSADARWPTTRIFTTATELGERLAADAEDLGETE